MQPEYLTRLSEPVRQSIFEVEEKARIFIQVVTDASLDGLGPLGEGRLEIETNSRRTRLFAPANGYFPDGAVHHEILHVRRFHLEGVPKLVLAETVVFDRGLAEVFTALDNGIEHLVIVPEELRLYPDRRHHWERVMADIWSSANDIPETELRLAVCMHWAFQRHALPASPQLQVAIKFMRRHHVMEQAQLFADQILGALADKEKMISILVTMFPEMPWHSAALEYLRGRTAGRT
jgi:hypothetical protein